MGFWWGRITPEAEKFSPQAEKQLQIVQHIEMNGVNSRPVI